MTLTYPLGLLCLIGIPIVIIIYILRSKYNEQTVSSTFLWRLSEKFLKRRNPLSGLTGLISLILQILTIAVISFAIARPVFVLPGAANDYCFVLDASGSMNMESGKSTRFELAKDEIIDVIKDSKRGSSYTLITVASDSVLAFDGVTDKDSAIDIIGDLSAENTALDNATLLSTAQERFDKNPSSLVYVVSDKRFSAHENVELIEVGDTDVENSAVFTPTYSHAGGKLSVSADVVSYTGDKTLKVRLLVDGKEAAEREVYVKAGERTPVSFEYVCSRFESFEVRLDGEDGYPADDRAITYNVKGDKTYSNLIVSETGFFLRAVIDALLDSEVTLISPKQYGSVTEQYGLYIFDSYEPEVLPDGAVWLINADESIADSGFGIRGKVDLGAATAIEKSKSTSTTVRRLLNSVDGSGIHITNYVKYSGMYLNFATLFTYDSNPLIFAGANGLGNRQVVIGFDLHESDFALSTDFIMLVRNLLEYSFPEVVDETNYVVGEDAIVNVVSGAENLKAIAPSGKELYVESDGATAAISLTEIGTYTIKLTLSGAESSYKIYSGADPEESAPYSEGGELSLSGEREHKSIDGSFDATTLLFICLALLFIADWGVYCYEKYQLR